MNDKKGLVFYTSTNSKGRKDATGAFIPEAKNFSKIHNIPEEDQVGIDCRKLEKWDRRKIVYNVLNEQKNDSLSKLAFFCHGFPTHIQFGIYLNHLGELADILADKLSNNAKIIFYACSTMSSFNKGVSDGLFENDDGPCVKDGFCDTLRDRLVEKTDKYFEIFGHTGPGHATMFPYVAKVSPIEHVTEDMDGANWVISPLSRDLWKSWCIKLKKTDLRYKFPWLTKEELTSQLLS
jgi:hypothetical protein